MILDSSALINLEILESSYDPKRPKALYLSF